MLDLDQVRAFVAVAEEGSVNRAARQLHRSQPAVTRQVQRLEAALGVALFDRRTKPLALTAAGAAALERGRALLTAADELAAATAGGALPAGELRLGVAHSLAGVALVDPVDRLRSEFPDVALRFTTGWSRALLEQVRAAALDAAALLLPAGGAPPAGLEGTILRTEPLVFVASRRARLPAVLARAHLVDAAWVLNPEGCGYRAWLARTLQGLGAPFRVAVEAHGLDLQLSLIARGLGLGLVPARALARSRFRSDLRRVRLPGPQLRMALWIVRGRPPAPLLPVLARFEEALRRRFAAAGVTASPGGPRTARAASSPAR